LQAQLQHDSESRAWSSASAILQSAAAETAAWKAQAAQQAATIKQQHEATIASLQLCQVGLAFSFSKLHHQQQRQHEHQLQQQHDRMQLRLGMCGAALSGGASGCAQLMLARCSSSTPPTWAWSAADQSLEARNGSLQQQEAQLQRTVAVHQQQVQELTALQQQLEQQLQQASAAAAASANTLQLVQSAAVEVHDELVAREEEAVVREDALLEEVDQLTDQVSALQQQLSEQQAAAAGTSGVQPARQ